MAAQILTDLISRTVVCYVSVDIHLTKISNHDAKTFTSRSCLVDRWILLCAAISRSGTLEYFQIFLRQISLLYFRIQYHKFLRSNEQISSFLIVPYMYSFSKRFANRIINNNRKYSKRILLAKKLGKIFTKLIKRHGRVSALSVSATRPCIYTRAGEFRASEIIESQ